MPTSPANPGERQVPLCVDLDGTLIQTDLLWESIARLLRRNPFQLFPVLFWWARGRAFLKKKLAARVTIDPATLPYNEPFLAFLREQKRARRQLVLATASDRKMALPVANYVGLFDEVLGSDGRQNLRGANKVKALVEKFGEQGFDYAGNSAPDLLVWRGAREAIVVNASRALVDQAAQCAKLGPVFIENYEPFGTLKSFLYEVFWRSGYLIAIVAGLLLTAAFPKFGVAGFAWVAPALMVAAARGKGGADAFRVGYVAGLAHFLTSLYWLMLMPVTGLPILAWVALCAYLAFYFGVWTWLLSRWGERPREPLFQTSDGSSVASPHQTWSYRFLWSLGGAASWVALEMVRARLLSGFPWNFIGVSQYQMVPLIQIASVTGVYGVSFLVVWTSLSLYSAASMVLQRPNTRLIWQAEIILPFSAVVALFVFGFVCLSGGNPAPSLRLTLIQPSFPQTLIWNPAEDARRFQQLLVLSQEALRATNEIFTPAADGSTAVQRGTTNIQHPTSDTQSAEDSSPRPSPPWGRRGSEQRASLLVWPESAVPDMDFATCQAISQLAQSNRLWIIFNGQDEDASTNYFNAAFLVNPAGRLAGVYHKRKLVIFGEYIPLVRWIPFIKYLTPITDGWTPGTNAVQFNMQVESREPRVEGRQNEKVLTVSLEETIRISPLICFEDTFPGLARDAADKDTDFLVDLTNDGWFRQSAEQWQHMANAVFRAVENGLPLVCCANNGITCWIDAHSRVREIFKDAKGSVYGAGAITFDLPVDEHHAMTFYHRHGDWFGWGCVGICLAALIRNAIQRKKD